MTNSNATKHAVIVGESFAGMNCVERPAAHKYFHSTPDNAALNLWAVLATHENVEVTMADVRRAELATRSARSKNGHECRGDNDNLDGSNKQARLAAQGDSTVTPYVEVQP